jgi:hypothetical protein
VCGNRELVCGLGDTEHQETAHVAAPTLPHCRQNSAPVSVLTFAALLALPCLSANDTIGVEKEDDYISQTYIDTLVDRAFYMLNTAGPMTGSGYSLEEAIAFAKETIERLKELAVGNQNERYILWKASELEGQVYLEEMGLLEERATMKQKMINNLARPFNAEIGKHRPDFGPLRSIEQNMKEIDSEKGAELERLLDDRIKNISREVVYFIETAIENENYDRARAELAYCKENQQFLKVSLTAYSRLAAKVRARVTIDQELAFITASSERAQALFAENKLDDARRETRTISVRLDLIKDATIRKEWDKHYFRNRKLVSAIERKEDSLVTVNLSKLKNEGIYAATSYLNSVVRPYGVSPHKAGEVDYAILERAVALAKEERSPVSADIAAAIDTSSEGNPSLDDLLAAAKRRAKEEALMTSEEKAELTQIAEVRRQRLRIAQENMQRRENQRQWQHVEQARKSVVQIYALLETKQVKQAYEQFSDARALLQANISKDDFSKLEAAVTSAYGTTPAKTRRR